MAVCGAGCVVSLVLLGMVLSGIPAFAQVDFSGEWSPRFYEDEPERVPGPELGDYLGLPINDAARERADTWQRQSRVCRNGSAGRIRPITSGAAPRSFA